MSLFRLLLVGTLVPTLNLVNQARSKSINTFAGPYIAIIHKLDSCPSDGTLQLNTRVSHFNPSRPYDLPIFTGNATLKEDLRDNYWSRADLAVRSNNQWKENAFIFNFPKQGCTAIREQVPDFFRVLAKLSGASTDKGTPCVVPAGVYLLKNEMVNLTFPNFPVIPYARYRFKVTASHSRNFDTPLLCLAVDCEAIPKP
ncbi:uncharacterized protein LOC117648375 [Thrips palmi]|uniref:Uncharacterized protein LOC117648375 n=1 Tax=Thrips palmi TaxID=161013 RepID=A0A6P8ZCU5_THRPL|nr:uncharacterized protein LOC117648375 [Thrips palmi]